MSFPPHLPASIRVFAAGVVLDSLFSRAAEEAAKVRGWIQSVAGRLMERLPPEKRRLVLIASIGVFSVFLLVFTGASLAARVKPDGRSPAAAGRTSARQGLISSDELFLPDEPDFVPGVLPEREQRTMWTADDAVPLWQDPLKNGEEPWRNRIEKTIDDIMESIP